MNTMPSLSSQRGVSLIEVLITMVVVAFGLLGLAAFQAKAQVGSIESYQRAQAAVLLQDMQSRLSGNSANAADYKTANPLGTGSTVGDDCATVAAGAARDLCEWSAALKGAAEERADGNKAGAMEGARGCVELVRAADASPGVCVPAVYLVTVAWQGMHETRAPSQSCGRDAYGPDTNRRAVSARVAIGLPGCI
ncbi:MULTISPECIES: type IV pilus modification protein PilV [unclassified Massilia]|uniref:type IV pilus modification protein PilV n=1 Tax=unclassified Massilia TaxID=2609279 RepID=UPI001E3E0B78|nr:MULTISPECIES: type IV pilus modification protein PilV [unclassified Massilia]